MLRNLHRAQFGRHGRTYAAGDDDAGQNRPQLAAHGDRHDAAQGRLSAVPQQDIHDLQGHNHAGKEKGQADDGQGIDPQMSHLRDRQAALNFGKLSQGLDE